MRGKMKETGQHSKKMGVWSIAAQVFFSLLVFSVQPSAVWSSRLDMQDAPLLHAITGFAQALQGRKMMFTIMALSLGAMYYLVRRQETKWQISLLSAFFSFSSVLGQSYLERNDWNGIAGGINLGIALARCVGYFFLFRNTLLFLTWLFEKYKSRLLRTETVGKLEKWLFGQRRFVKFFAFFFITGLPYLIFFFPGTMQWDAALQIRQYLGLERLTGQQPVTVTVLMGICIDVGRHILHSDGAGMFLYTGGQFVMQCFVFTYLLMVMCKWNAPLLLRWGTLLFFGVYPIFPIWGYTLVKDTGYYIFTLLFFTALADILEGHEKTSRYKLVLFLVGLTGVCLFRNDGRYVIFVTLIYAICFYRRYRRYFVAGLVCAFVFIGLVEGVYMPIKGIPSGPVKEMMAVPLQQTARYIKEYPEEITGEEREILEAVFEGEIENLGELYQEELVDSVKYQFVYSPSSEDLRAYFSVWAKGLIRHPGVYIQAFLNHVYGYFYPDRDNVLDSWAVYYMGSSDWWPGDYVYISFLLKDSVGREMLREFGNLVHGLPVLGLMGNCGFYTYLLLGLAAFYSMRRKPKDFLILIPSCCVLLLCLVSPVGAYFRYMLPIVVLMPLDFLWYWKQGI